MSDYLKVVLRRAFASGDPALLQVSFDAAVLDRYRADPAYQVMRTNTAGRVRKQAGWALDFGIVEGDRTLHASWAALMQSLDEGERDHWAAHAVPSASLSENFLRMQLAPSSCFDDGELRTWS
jgi:hypothetical protein